MSINRRQFLLGTAAGLTAAALAGCRSVEQLATNVTIPAEHYNDRSIVSRAAAERALNRIGYGHAPGEIGRLQLLGLEQFVDQQLHPESIVESALFDFRIATVADQLSGGYDELFEQDDHSLIGTLGQASLLRAAYSNRQLLERMCEFWSDHFNIFAYKADKVPQYTVMFQRDVIRPHALGNFRQLLGATAESAAILTYLDNDINVAGRPNENYAREIMELHTLGINGGYSQHDVREVARCLTGWRTNQKFFPGTFLFDSGSHDTLPKQVLGATLEIGGKRDMEEVLDRLAAHPATAVHIAKKLLRRFQGEFSDEHVKFVAGVFGQTDGDIAKTVRAVLLECDVPQSAPIFKRPFDYVVSSIRAMGVDTDCSALPNYLARMGQPMHEWPRPDGYPEGEAPWLNSLSVRWQFALDLSAETIPNTSINWDKIGVTKDDIFQRLYGSSRSSFDSEQVKKLGNDMRDVKEFTALCLMAPGFQWK